MTRVPHPLRDLMAACTLSLAVAAVAQSATDFYSQGTAAYNAKHYAESADLFRKAIAAAPDDSTRSSATYNLACDQALNRQPDDAFATLNQLPALGFTDRKQIEGDPDLNSLHADPRWSQLLTLLDHIRKEQDLRWGSTTFKTPYAPDISDKEKLAGLAELWAQARYGFANFWHVPNLDWDKTYLDFIPQVIATKSTAEYYRVLARFYALLQDGHSGAYPPKEIDYGRVSVRTALVDGHVLILGSSDPAFDMQSMQPGDEILSVNGQPVAAYAAQQVLPYVTASSPQDRDSRVYTRQLFLSPPGTAFTVVIATPDGKQSTHTFTSKPWKYTPATPLVFRMLPGNIAYVALNGFDDDTAAKEWDNHWSEISKATSLILDLRENGGGDDSVGAHILATLLDRPVDLPLSQSTRWIATYRAWGQSQTPLRFPPSTLAPDPTHHFSGKVAMLTSARTYSAAEDMVVVYATSHRGTLIGEPTGGSTGQPLLFPLPGGGTARICTKHDTFPDGHEFVGIGVPPDLPIHNSRHDIVKNHDSVLDAAIHAVETRQ